MLDLHERLPGNAALRDAVVSVLRAQLQEHGGLAALERRKNRHASTFASEVVEVSCGDGTVLRSCVKYGKPGEAGAVGERRAPTGVAYEALVHQRLLRRLDVAVPDCQGVHHDVRADTWWLFTAWCEDALQLHEAEPGGALRRAAEWLAAFHDGGAALLRRDPLPELRRHQLSWFVGFAQRALPKLASVLPRTDLLAWLERDYPKLLDRQLRGAAHVPVHGEFFAKNVLHVGGRIVPVDWESAAVSLPALDLAALTLRWGTAHEDDCTRAYLAQRCGASSPDAFATELALARVHWLCWMLARLRAMERAAWLVDSLTMQIVQLQEQPT